jgi:predicted HD phosphohydrolase
MIVPVTFTRMDESTTDEWQQIIVETIAYEEGMADRILAMLAQLEYLTVGFAVNQLVHSLQTATRAEEAGASTEVVVASLCHDIGKTVSVMNHPRVAAEILRPYVSDDTYHMILAHQDFQGRHYYEYIGQDTNARERYEGQPWFALAEQFADDWDQTSFDPDYPTKPLSHFEPMVREVFGSTRSF